MNERPSLPGHKSIMSQSSRSPPPPPPPSRRRRRRCRNRHHPSNARRTRSRRPVRRRCSRNSPWCRRCRIGDGTSRIASRTRDTSACRNTGRGAGRSTMLERDSTTTRRRGLTKPTTRGSNWALAPRGGDATTPFSWSVGSRRGGNDSAAPRVRRRPALLDGRRARSSSRRQDRKGHPRNTRGRKRSHYFARQCYSPRGRRRRDRTPSFRSPRRNNAHRRQLRRSRRPTLEAREYYPPTTYPRRAYLLRDGHVSSAASVDDRRRRGMGCEIPVAPNNDKHSPRKKTRSSARRTPWHRRRRRRSPRVDGIPPKIRKNPPSTRKNRKRRRRGRRLHRRWLGSWHWRWMTTGRGGRGGCRIFPPLAPAPTARRRHRRDPSTRTTTTARGPRRGIPSPPRRSRCDRRRTTTTTTTTRASASLSSFRRTFSFGGGSELS